MSGKDLSDMNVLMKDLKKFRPSTHKQLPKTKSGEIFHTITCWGCDKVQGDGEKFKNCPLCLEKKITPCRFCSDECFREHWKRHKEWHKSLDRKLEGRKLGAKEGAMILKSFKEDKRSLEQGDNYGSQCIDARMMLSRGNHAKSKKKLKKLIRDEPDRPEAYSFMGSVYLASNQRKEAVHYMESGNERWAIACLSSTIGTIPYKGLYSYDHWMKNLFNAYVEYMLDASLPKPYWFDNDASLICIGNAMLSFYERPESYELIKEHMSRELRDTYVTQAKVLCGTYCRNMRMMDVIFLDNQKAPDERTREDLEKSIEYFTKAIVLTNEKSIDGYFCDQAFYVFVDQVKAMLRAMSREEKIHISRDDKDFLFAGCWIITCGSTENIPSLNRKVGLITEVDKKNSRFKVKIDKLENETFLRAENISKLSMNEKTFALISCLETETRWSYVRKMAKSKMVDS